MSSGTRSDNLQLTGVPSAHAEMLIRRPPEEVFGALVDPTVTTRFWFTRSSGPLEPGAQVRWDWEMYGASAEVRVKQLERPARLVFEWGGGTAFSTVEIRFDAWKDGGTRVRVEESGFTGDGDAVAARAADSGRGFTIMLCALKALLEHGIVLTAVLDAHPASVKG